MGNTEKVILKAGAVILTRDGRNSGSYVSPAGTSFEQRSLARTTKMDDYHEFIVKSDIKNVESGIIAAWFGLPGGGIQYKLPQMVSDLLRKGVLAEVTPHEL